MLKKNVLFFNKNVIMQCNHNYFPKSSAHAVIFDFLLNVSWLYDCLRRWCNSENENDRAAPLMTDKY